MTRISASGRSLRQGARTVLLACLLAARALAAESPALAEPALPERRFPVVPRLQRRRR